MGLSFRTIQPHIRAEAPLPLLCALRRHGPRPLAVGHRSLVLFSGHSWSAPADRGRPRYLDYRQGAGWHLIFRPLTSVGESGENWDTGEVGHGLSFRGEAADLIYFRIFTHYDGISSPLCQEFPLLSRHLDDT